jgi:hypothetical protein
VVAGAGARGADGDGGDRDETEPSNCRYKLHNRRSSFRAWRGWPASARAARFDRRRGGAGAVPCRPRVPQPVAPNEHMARRFPVTVQRAAGREGRGAKNTLMSEAKPAGRGVERRLRKGRVAKGGSRRADLPRRN